MKRLLFLLAVILLSLASYSQLVFTTGPSTCSGAGGLLCIGSSCTGANNASDVSLTSFASVNVLLGVACSNTITSNYSSLQTAGHWAGFRIRGTNLLTLISSISIRITNTGTSQSQTVSGAGLLTLLSSDAGYAEFQSTIGFDRIELILNGVAALAQSVDVFFGFSNAVNRLDVELPVTWTSFSGKLVDGKVELNWSTATEINSARFEVERSPDGSDFYSIGSIRAAGNSFLNSSYTFNDDMPVKGMANYYRLKQVDLDGSYSYSVTIKINLPGTNVFNAQVVPNPAKNYINISIEGVGSNEKLKFEIMDINGKRIHSEEATFTGSVFVKNISSTRITAGIYFYKVTRLSNGQSLHGRLILE